MVLIVKTLVSQLFKEIALLATTALLNSLRIQIRLTIILTIPQIKHFV